MCEINSRHTITHLIHYSIVHINTACSWTHSSPNDSQIIQYCQDLIFIIKDFKRTIRID